MRPVRRRQMSRKRRSSYLPRIISIQVTDDLITARLADGRSISVPMVWSWRLSEATPEQRNNFEIIGNGLGVHWPDVDGRRRYQAGATAGFNHSLKFRYS